KVLVPEAAASTTVHEPTKVTVDLPPAKGEKTKRLSEVKLKEGTNDLSVSVPVPAGKDTVTVSVAWQPNNYTTITRSRSVKVKPGVEVTADLTAKDDKQPDDIKVRYVPTPQDVVEAMCKLGRVGKDDVVYDLGCGDGRLVITAVKKFGAKRGVGVDIDADLVKKCKAKAKEAGVEDKVEFRVGDVLKIEDMSAATVVLLYMGDDINNRLRP